MVNAASSPLLARGLRPPIVVDICKETKAILGVTVVAKELEQKAIERSTTLGRVRVG